MTELKDYYNPEWDLLKGGKELVKFFEEINFTEDEFRGRACIRLQQLNWFIDYKFIDANFRVRD